MEGGLNLDNKAPILRDICIKFITLAAKGAGWDELAQIREDGSFTNGLVLVLNSAARSPACVTKRSWHSRGHAVSQFELQPRGRVRARTKAARIA